ncbi:hypothetical protein BH24CHL5_BH24CHL5_09910 [soil metagenome]
MPTGFVFVDTRTFRAPGGRKHDVLDAIKALSWTPQLCPLMQHAQCSRSRPAHLSTVTRIYLDALAVWG